MFPRDLCSDVSLRQCAESPRGMMCRTVSSRKGAHESIRITECSMEYACTRRLTDAVTSVHKILLAVSRLAERRSSSRNGSIPMEGTRAVPAPLPTESTARELEALGVAPQTYSAWYEARLRGRGRNAGHKRLAAEQDHVSDTVSVDSEFFDEQDQTAKLVLIEREHVCRWTGCASVLKTEHLIVRTFVSVFSVSYACGSRHDWDVLHICATQKGIHTHSMFHRPLLDGPDPIPSFCSTPPPSTPNSLLMTGIK